MSDSTEMQVSNFLDKEPQGIPSCFDAWDKVNGGIPRTALMLITTRTGFGKSTMVNVMARNMAHAGFRPVIVPLEISDEEMFSRLMSSISGIPVHKVSQGKNKLSKADMKKVEKDFRDWDAECKKNGGTHIVYDPRTLLTMTQLLEGVKQHNPDIVFIDYVELLAGVDGDDGHKLLEAAREAKEFAMTHKIPVVLVAQTGEGREWEYSKRMVDYADLVWTWKKEENDGAGPSETIRVHQLKSRNMNPAPFDLKVDWACVNMKDVDWRHYANEVPQ